MNLRFLQGENRKKTVNILFYVAFTIELLFMVLEKSEISLPFISHVFRCTFLIALLAVLLMEHTRKEWIFVAIILAFSFVCYRLNGRNDILRFATFMLAARDIDLEKTMKFSFFFSAAGFLLIALLAAFGILGDVYTVADFGRGSVEARFSIGFGHPNTFGSSLYALLLLWIWLYGKKANIIPYICLIIASLVTYKLTGTRTALIINMFTIIIALVARFLPEISGKKIVYILSGLVTPIMCTAFSVWAAWISVMYWRVDHEIHWLYRLDRLFNGRIANLYYNTEAHEGALETWTLFSNRASQEIFDMGWVRLFYWYGIIPASIVVLLIIAAIYLCYQKRDIWTVILIVSLGIYTVIEATFVSRYIGRVVVLPILAVYFGEFLHNYGGKNA